MVMPYNKKFNVIKQENIDNKNINILNEWFKNHSFFLFKSIFNTNFANQ